MLCFGLEDELKIFRKFCFNENEKFKKYEEENGEADVETYKEADIGEGVEKGGEVYENENEDGSIKGNVGNKKIFKKNYLKEKYSEKKYVQKEEYLGNTNFVRNTQALEDKTILQRNIKNGITLDDEVIFLSISICNSFIYIITKYCFYIFDNSDFSFITFSTLKYEKIQKYGYYKKVFLSPIDNTIYIISENLRYVYAYYVSNKEDVLVLDSKKKAFRMNIKESIEENTSEDESEYYEYMSYIKNIYKKKKKNVNT